jgi:RNA polymerase sigma factor (sigma-70 family)
VGAAAVRSCEGQAARAPSSGSDRAAFTRFYRQTYWQAYAFTRRRIDSDDAARDVVAEAFRIVWQKREVALERGLAFVYATCRNLLGNEYQRHAREAALLDRLALDWARSGHHEQMDLIQVLRQLPADHREVLYLTYWEDLPAGDIAQVLDCSVQAVWKRLSRARSLLRDLLTRDDTMSAEPAPTSTTQGLS